MKYVRIRSYHNSEFTGCEHLYMGNNQVEALARFCKEYPEHDNCILIAEYFDSEKPENKPIFEAFVRCGCVH